MYALFYKGLSSSLCGLLLLQLVACGTLIYPERRGQKAGELDPVIVVLDAIGLIFFIIPGVAAFIIDFDTGAIYLPQGKGSKERLDKISEGFKGARVESGSDGSTVVRVDPALLTPATVEYVGQVLGDGAFSFRHPDLQIQILDSASNSIMPVAAWTTASFRSMQCSL
jgi:hypothetical protein